ncbi:MAG: amino acid ABC transporter permease [Gammaproteobacteria bacterium]|nr:amino acid ABC transporter permease [Gammaproteobacteria bacterium]NIR85024.1 amino acid ABC transporter permease [Gammaproteobacteria bacterium]NIR88291.1 amino acid ABC transporter permease [Gammaproteobacteria bacterium]NIU06071.1 amino acid ABC transporter permease [Gammaproteobacteria bacterium]NIV73490.1 ABC transporter permease subunit [Gammaproteobacteria bacterium]
MAYFTGVLLKGAVVAVEITAGALVVAVVLGLALAILRSFRVPPIVWLIDTYVEIFRTIPPLSQLFIIYFGLTYIGLEFDSVTAAIVGLGLNGGAVLCEVFGSGIQALHHGQREAALSVGLTPLQALRHIILPQALRITAPPLANYSVNLLKETSIVAAIAAPEIMFYARMLTTETFQTATIYLLAAILYFCLCFPLTRVANRLEQARRSWQ